MSKDPAFLFYPNDYIGGTMGMTFEEKGAYIELLMTQFNRGHLSSQVIGQVVGQLWDKIQDKFKVDEHGLYYNERLDVEINKRKTFVQSRFNNLTGKNQYTKKEAHTEGHTTTRMEDEDVNVIDSIISKYNSTSFAKVEKITDQRKKHIRARIKDYGVDNILLMIERANKSDFLHGINDRRWKADFDWLMNPNNYVKVIEGKFDNKKLKLAL